MRSYNENQSKKSLREFDNNSSVKNRIYDNSNVPTSSFQKKIKMSEQLSSQEISLNEHMMIFLLKVELKRICGRKNYKNVFEMNNPKNSYQKKVFKKQSNSTTKHAIQKSDAE